jgi:hypothetical protein
MNRSIAHLLSVAQRRSFGVARTSVARTVPTIHEVVDNGGGGVRRRLRRAMEGELVVVAPDGVPTESRRPDGSKGLGGTGLLSHALEALLGGAVLA